MIKVIDNLLNRITMYRLVLYYLLFLWILAVIFGYFGVLPYQPSAIIFCGIFIVVICWAANNVFAHVFEAHVNVESVYITALILALIISPLKSIGDVNGWLFLGWAAIWAMASKYILAIKKKHIFNPAAFAVVLTAFTINQSASWWVGTLPMFPFVLIGGILIARKIVRFDLVLSFLIAATLSVLYFGISRGTGPVTVLEQVFFHAPLFFFAFVMLTEPLTTPPTKILRVAYGLLVGFLFAPAIHIGTIYSTPELALLVGNIFSYAISPKSKLVLKLKEKIPVATDTYDFIFTSDQKLSFHPGQYLEWTLGNVKSDSRGNRRYFTIASSPTENEIRIGVKFYPRSSSFKKSLQEMEVGDTIVASQLAGDFTMPRNKKKKLVFIAGGIGITPFRSMLKYLSDNNEKRNAVLLYSNKTAGDIAYKDIFDEAGENIGVKTIYTLTDKESVPESWPGERGFIDGQMIMREIPDYEERTFYISGPRSMVTAFKETLQKIGIHKNHIKTDYFPGFV